MVRSESLYKTKRNQWFRQLFRQVSKQFPRQVSRQVFRQPLGAPSRPTLELPVLQMLMYIWEWGRICLCSKCLCTSGNGDECYHDCYMPPKNRLGYMPQESRLGYMPQKSWLGYVPQQSRLGHMPPRSRLGYMPQKSVVHAPNKPVGVHTHP